MAEGDGATRTILQQLIDAAPPADVFHGLSIPEPAVMLLTALNEGDDEMDRAIMAALKFVVVAAKQQKATDMLRTIRAEVQAVKLEMTKDPVNVLHGTPQGRGMLGLLNRIDAVANLHSTGDFEAASDEDSVDR